MTARHRIPSPCSKLSLEISGQNNIGTIFGGNLEFPKIKFMELMFHTTEVLSVFKFTLNPRGHATHETFPTSLTRHIDRSKQGFSFLQASLELSEDGPSWTQVRPLPVVPTGQLPQTKSLSPKGKHSTPGKQGLSTRQASTSKQSIPSPVNPSGQGPHSKDVPTSSRLQPTPVGRIQTLA